MAGTRDPVVDSARKLALALAVFDVGLGLVAMYRPAALNRLFGGDGGERFYARWGVQILAYAAVQAAAAAVPTPATLNAAAALRAVEVPADLLAGRRATHAGRTMLPMASAFNVGATALFAAAARRARNHA